MERVLLLIMAAALCSYSLFGRCDALVHPFITDYGQDEADYGDDFQPPTPAAPTPTPNHIMRIKSASELRESTPVELTKYIDAAAYDSGTRATAADSGEKSAESATAETLTYTELGKLLGLWYERNVFKMNLLEEYSDKLREISANAVTPRSYQ